MMRSVDNFKLAEAGLTCHADVAQTELWLKVTFSTLRATYSAFFAWSKLTLMPSLDTTSMQSTLPSGDAPCFFELLLGPLESPGYFVLQNWDSWEPRLLHAGRLCAKAASCF